MWLNCGIGALSIAPQFSTQALTREWSVRNNMTSDAVLCCVTPHAAGMPLANLFVDC